MYLTYFGLAKNPFSLTPDPQFLFLTPKHREALAALLLAVTQRKGFVVLTGDAGTGKTTLVRKLLLSIPSESARFSVIVNPALTRSEFLELILLEFGLEEIPSSKALRLRLFNEFLLRAQKEAKIPVVVVDEAHLLTADLMDELRLLSNFETSEEKLLQVVLAGQSELNAVLQLESMRQVRQRIAIRVDITPLSPVDVAQYLETRWKRAAATARLPFSEEAINLIALASEGIPRLINVFCDAALLNAYGSGVKTIGVDLIEDVLKDFHVAIPFRSANSGGEPTGKIPKSLPRPPGRGTDQPSSGIASIDRYFPESKRVNPFHQIASWFGGARH